MTVDDDRQVVELRDVLRALARETSRSYADPDAAVAAARTRRRTVSALVAACVLVLAVGVGVAVAVARVPSWPHRPPTVVGPVDPADLGPPPAGADLPTDHPVGRAVVAVSRRPGADPGGYVVLADGHRFGLPGVVPGDPVALSPDGRWLAWNDGANLVVRDLLGTAVRRHVPSLTPVAWSPGGTYLLLRAVNVYVVLDVRDPTLTPARLIGRNWTPVGPLDNGSVLLAGRHPADADRSAIGLREVDPRTGQVTAERTVTVQGLGGTDESLYPGSTGSAAPGGGSAGEPFPVVAVASGARPVRVGVFTGPNLRGLVELDSPSDTTGESSQARRDVPAGDGWRLVAAAGPGPVLARPLGGADTELVVLDTATGESRGLGVVPGAERVSVAVRPR